MLWFDNDPKTSLEAKIGKAAEYYKRKYGQEPDVCLVNPKQVGLRPTPTVGDPPIRVEAMREVLLGHLWIGREESQHGDANPA
jgi:hypothetical protein